MTLIEKTLKLLDLDVNERFHIKGCTNMEGDLIDYCIDYSGHLLYETIVNGKTRWVNSKFYNLVKILNGNCDIIYKDDQSNSVDHLEIPDLQESSSAQELIDAKKENN